MCVVSFLPSSAERKCNNISEACLSYEQDTGWSFGPKSSNVQTTEPWRNALKCGYYLDCICRLGYHRVFSTVHTCCEMTQPLPVRLSDQPRSTIPHLTLFDYTHVRHWRSVYCFPAVARKGSLVLPNTEPRSWHHYRDQCWKVSSAILQLVIDAMKVVWDQL